MKTSRLEAFSDGVIAILITIMVLELRVPHGATWEALKPLCPTLLAYLLSFIYIGIYWNNHHHMFQVTGRVTGSILWANLHLLFWLSLIPFVTGWLGDNEKAALPTALYGVVLLLCGFAYSVLAQLIMRDQGEGSKLRAAIGKDRKGFASLVLYVAAITLAFESVALADALYVVVALMWLVPDPRIEKRIEQGAVELRD